MRTWLISRPAQIKSWADRRGRAGSGQGPPLTYARNGYARLRATAEKVGFALA
jgi:hypothetical protein